MEFLTIVGEVGFPIAGAIAAGYFVFLTIKFILAGVTGGVNGLKNIIKALSTLKSSGVLSKLQSLIKLLKSCICSNAVQGDSAQDLAKLQVGFTAAWQKCMA